MGKHRLLLFLPLFAGLALMVCSWWSSYPLSIDSIDDVIFNHVSLLYWISLPLLLASMYMINITFKNQYLKWITTIGIVLTMFSLSYFYYMIRSSDSQAFRGLTEYFIKTKDLNPSKNSYFQWPSFFLLSDMVTSVTGMNLTNFEFLLYTIIGFLWATALYVYASRAYKYEGFLAVAAFFVALFYFINYQAVPFSLAFGLLFLLFILETRQKSFAITVTMLVLFTGISFTHAFVPLFFVLYLSIRYILNRSKQYGHYFLMTLTIYLVVQITQAQLAFAENIRIALFSFESSEYSSITKAILAPVSVPIDQIAQMFSRSVTIATVLICLACFTVLLIKRKMRDVDKAIFFAGVVYSASGFAIYTLGSRAIPIVFIPISLGASYILKSRFRPYAMSLFLVLLILFVFVPLHGTFYTNQIDFQTKEAYQAENFFINHYNWANQGLILAHVAVIYYFKTKQPSLVHFEGDVGYPLFPRIKEYDSIVYTLGLGINLLRYNYTIEKILYEEKSNDIYDNGFSHILIKSSNFK